MLCPFTGRSSENCVNIGEAGPKLGLAVLGLGVVWVIADGQAVAFLVWPVFG